MSGPSDRAAGGGAGALPRSEVGRVRDCTRRHDLQDSTDRREILADDKLTKVFGKDRATMFEMNRSVAAHGTA